MKLSLQSCDDGDLGLAVGLRVIDRGGVMLDLALIAEVPHLVAHELCPVIDGDGARHAKVADNVLPEELDNLLPRDGR